jgi:hypothetical protein
MVAAAVAVGAVLGGCSYRFLFWERNVWQDTRGIFSIVEPADLGLYRELLPQQFSMPDQPMVGLYVVHFVDTEPRPITAAEYLFPYFEATVLLRCEYEGQIGWYSHVMPVSTEAAMIGGRRLGFPKYVADEMLLEPIEKGWRGTAAHEGRDRISLRFAELALHELGPLSPLEEEFVAGKGDDANLRGPIILLNPPGEGPEVNVFHCSPPPLAFAPALTRGRPSYQPPQSSPPSVRSGVGDVRNGEGVYGCGEPSSWRDPLRSTVGKRPRTDRQLPATCIAMRAHSKSRCGS